MSLPIMNIVGFGRMGKRFSRLFSSDFDVRVSTSRDVREEVFKTGATVVNDKHSALAYSDYIFLAVPLTALPELIAKANECSKADTVIIDCCSVRVIAEQLLSKLNRRHFGIHDLREGEYCVTGDIDARMIEFFNRNGIRINHMLPEDHDRINAVIGLGHFIGLSLGKFLSKDQIEILAGIGSGRKLIALVSHFSENSHVTWHETQMDNCFTKEMRASLIEALTQFHETLSRGKYPFENDEKPDPDTFK